MDYAIIGFGNVGQALAKMFARQNIQVTVATTRSPDELAEKARAIGENVITGTLEQAIGADIVLLAVPFPAHRDVARAASGWQGRIVVDVTNSYGIAPEELGNRPSSAVVAEAFKGAGVVKAFNHLGAEVLAQDPAVHGGKRVIFLASDDDKAMKPVADLVERLGFAPVSLGRLAEGGQLVQARGKSWAPLIFQDLVKFDQAKS